MSSRGAPPAAASTSLWRRESEWLRERFGAPTRRLPIDARLPCPNRDGTCGTGGCVFCEPSSFSPAVAHREKDITTQLDTQLARLSARDGPPKKHLAYFQTGTNTHAPPATLESLWREALQHPRVAGLVIGTRPDALPEVVCRLLGDLSRTHFISVELGLQSLNDETLRWMNRGHTAQVFFDALARLRQASEGRVHTGAHVVFGFPGDSISTAEEMATRLSEAKIDAVKVHNLHIVRGTPLESLHQSDTWKLPTRETYIQMVMAFLTHLDSRVVVQRLIADAPAESLVAPPWMGDKTSFLRDLEAAMRAKGVAQGSLRVPEKA